MNQSTTEQHLRHFLLGVTAFIFIGTATELALLEHYEEAIQWAPFILSGLGLITVLTVWKNASRNSLMALRWVMVLVALGSLLGIYLHLSNNWGFVMEMKPNYSTMEVIWPAIKGPYPLLAPGILFLAGVLGGAVTYKHPALQE